MLELLGGPKGLTTMLPNVPSQVEVFAAATSDITLPAVEAPSGDLLTLLGGADGLTTVLPEMPLETPDIGLPGLNNPDVEPVTTTDIISPPDAATDIGDTPQPTPDDAGDAARPTIAFAAGAAGAGVLGLVAFVL